MSVTPCPSFQALVAEVYGPLQRYLRRRTDEDTAADVLGDVLVVMWRRQADIPPEASVAWCYGVARGCLANAQRGSRRHLTLLRRLAAEPPAEPLADTAGEDPALAEALQSLAVRDREVLRLWAWEQLTASQIAQVLDVTPNAASIRLHRAKEKLKQELLRRKDPDASGHPVDRQKEEWP
jgi:RNA polymerase sigma-70 factor (ECF subfamily)